MVEHQHKNNDCGRDLERQFHDWERDHMEAARSATILEQEDTSAPVHQVIYLACPYTHPDPAVRQARFETATAVAADLIRAGHIIYSPITMTHPIDLLLAGESNTLGSDYWVAFDEAFMDMCSEMVVIQIDGWKRSNGVRREIEYFKQRKKPIRYIDPPHSKGLSQ